MSSMKGLFMPSSKVLPKRFDVLDANDPRCSFRINIDVLNECFGANRSMYMHACYPQGKNKSIPGTKNDEKFFVWMPKLFGNSSEWKNLLVDDGNTILEIAESSRHSDWMDEDKHIVDGLRLVFVKPSPNEWYRFAGVYASDKMDHLRHSYKRIATKVKLIGDPVTNVEILDDDIESPVIEEIAAIEADSVVNSLEGIDKLAVVKSRVNQGAFRELLIKKYGCCCLCGADEAGLLIASHIKPWADSTPKERVDVSNGLLLCPNHDRLFDKGYISFDSDGKIMISSSLNDINRCLMNVHEDMKVDLTVKSAEYMEYHRKHIFGQLNEE